MLFAEGRMEGVGGKYENDYAFKYILMMRAKLFLKKNI